MKRFIAYTCIILLSSCGKKRRAFKDIPELTDDMSTYQMLQILGDQDGLKDNIAKRDYAERRKAAKHDGVEYPCVPGELGPEKREWPIFE